MWLTFKIFKGLATVIGLALTLAYVIVREVVKLPVRFVRAVRLCRSGATCIGR